MTSWRRPALSPRFERREDMERTLRHSFT